MGQDTHTFPERKKKGKKAPDSVSEYILRRGGESGWRGGGRKSDCWCGSGKKQHFPLFKVEEGSPPPPSFHSRPPPFHRAARFPPTPPSVVFCFTERTFSPLVVFLLQPRRVVPLKRGGGRKGPSSSSSAFLSATSTSSLLIKQRTWARGDRGQKRKEEQTGNLH